MKKLIKSPLQLKANDPLFLVKLAADLLKVHNEFMSRVDEFTVGLKELATLANRIRNLPKGDRGERGFTGERGLAGRDGRDGKDGQDASELDIDTITAIVKGLVLQEMPKPQDGRDALIDQEAIVESVLSQIRSGKLLKKGDIFGLEEELVSTRSLAGKQYGKDTLVRGGGMTMSAGSNITLVPKADGTVEINASGGGSGTNVTTQYSLTATQAASNVEIDLTQLTNFATFADLIAVYRNNIMQTETIQFTVVGDIVTILDADAGEIFNITYAYS